MNDVVVIGAGIAGLVATRALQRAGLQVVLLEARDVVGGRIRSIEIDGGPVELGPIWVWGSEDPVLTLLDELDIALWQARQEGADIFESKTGIQHGRLPTSAVPEYRIGPGLFTVCERLLAQVQGVQFNTRVTKIHPHDDGVVVSASDEQWLTKHVVAALPPRLLARSIDIPGAPLDLWRQVPTWMANMAKVVAVFDDNTWAPQLSGRAISHLGPMVEVHDHSGPDGQPVALFGFVPRAQAGLGLEDRVRAQLARYYGPKAVPKRLLIHRWWTEPTLHSGDDESDDESLFGHPMLHDPALDGRLHLISSETSSLSPGHLAGAVERAQTVAHHLIQALR